MTTGSGLAWRCRSERDMSIRSGEEWSCIGRWPVAGEVEEDWLAAHPHLRTEDTLHTASEKRQWLCATKLDIAKGISNLHARK